MVVDKAGVPLEVVPASLAFVIPWAKISLDNPLGYFEMACQS
jgi:hypothetical protein